MTEEIVFSCNRHGDRTAEQVYKSKDKASVFGYRYKCKECTYLATKNRPCKIHGNVEDRQPSGKCTLCALSAFKALNKVRDEDRDTFNEKQRLKKEANPEWAAQEEKRKYANKVANHGNEVINERQKASFYGVSVNEFRQLFIDQDNKCAICNQPETRIFKKGGEMKVARLCLDHNHDTGKIRQLLCYACNTAIGWMKEDIKRLQSAIEYLKKHSAKQSE